MPSKLILKEGETQRQYVLEPVFSKGERVDGTYPITISVPEVPIDGCFIISLHQPQDYDVIHKNVGIVKDEDEIPEKLYQCAVSCGRKYAEHLSCEFVDSTERAKKTDLEQKVRN